MKIHKHTVARTPDMHPKTAGYDEIDVITGDYHSTTIVDNPRGLPVTSTGFIVRASDWNNLVHNSIITGNKCVWCGQNYYETEARYGTRAGCSKCGAPKGNM